MKPILPISVLIIGSIVFFHGCTPETRRLDSYTICRLDITDRMALRPTAQQLVAPLDLSNNSYQSVKVSISVISDRDINPSTVVTLPPDDHWTSNDVLRQGQVGQFLNQVQKCIDSLTFKGSVRHSVIYNAIVASCNELAASGALHRYLSIYSDLRENSTISFYNPATFDSLKKFPDSIEKRLTVANPLPDLNGVMVWLIYQPISSYQDNEQYIIIARFYKRLLEEHGATVGITNNISAP